MFYKINFSIITSTLFISTTLLAPINKINAFAQAKKNPQTKIHHRQEIAQTTNTQSPGIKKLDQEPPALTIALKEITPKPESTQIILEEAAIKTTTKEPELILNQEERKAAFNKEVSELLLEYKDQLALLEALETNPDFLKLATPIHAQKKALEEEINKIICQFIPEMTMFYQQIQTLLKKYQETN